MSQTPPAASADSIVTVLGLGAMGLPMAARLSSEFAVRGFDINEGRRDLAASAGVERFDSARSACTGSGIVLLAVRNEEQLVEVLFGAEGVAAVMAPGSVVILTSTVGTGAIPVTAERLAEMGIGFVDAPLSGGPVRAREGDLLILVGAEPAVLARVRPVLEALSSTLTIVGDAPGDGQAMKTVNQLLCGVHIAAAAEALALADRLGLDPDKALRALEAGAAGSFMLSNRGPRMLEAYDEGGAEVLSRLDIFVKDMGIVGNAVRAAGLPSPLAAAAEQLYLIAQAQGLGTADDSAVIRVMAPTRHSS
ncbi:NAD(P)-dependent oxidoreductase [Lacisediminihabitans sp. H27-G8]|uniref:NAD(P)-dependent oxidoreductase n=1 Tax=Lacisediminihabitans sp. H27-G8 TaxID=3111909 RepID=UPI0038FBE44D